MLRRNFPTLYININNLKIQMKLSTKYYLYPQICPHVRVIFVMNLKLAFKGILIFMNCEKSMWIRMKMVINNINSAF